MKNDKITSNMIQNFMNTLCSETLKYFWELIDSYGLNRSNYEIIMYSVLNRSTDIDDIANNKIGNRFVTCSTPLVCDGIIVDMISKVYFSQQSFYEIIISCLMDYDDILETLKFSIRHEVGHILANRDEIGNKYIHCLYMLSDHKPNTMKIRKNASMKSIIKVTLDYYHLQDEAYANSLVGITDDDIIEYVELTHGW